MEVKRIPIINRYKFVFNRNCKIINHHLECFPDIYDEDFTISRDTKYVFTPEKEYENIIDTHYFVSNFNLILTTFWLNFKFNHGSFVIEENTILGHLQIYTDEPSNELELNETVKECYDQCNLDDITNLLSGNNETNINNNHNLIIDDYLDEIEKYAKQSKSENDDEDDEGVDFESFEEYGNKMFNLSKRFI